MKRHIFRAILLVSVLFFPAHSIAEIIEIGPAKDVSAGNFPKKITLGFDREKIPSNIADPEKYIHAGYFNGEHWVRLPHSKISESKPLIEVTVSHPGRYHVICQTEAYGLKLTGNPNTDKSPYLLLIPGIATSRETWHDLKKYFTPKGFSFLEFDNPPGERIQNAAERLSKELRKLHRAAGDFKFNVIALGIGGLIANYYYGNDKLFQHDIDKLIVCLSTPYRDSKMADFATVSKLYQNMVQKQARIPNAQTIHQLFSFSDALEDIKADAREDEDIEADLKNDNEADALEDIEADLKNDIEVDALEDIKADLKHDSEVMKRIENLQSDRCEDSIRIESFSGIKPFKLDFPPEDIQTIPELLAKSGDGCVSLESSRWTPIERVPFKLSHFELPKSEEVFKSIEGFLGLEKFNYTLLFKNMASPEIRKKIARLWHREISLYYQDPRSVEFFINFNRNMLRSVPQNALLFTNGDMDTFPALYLQEIENFRKDVAVINLSLFNLHEVIKYLKQSYQLPTGLSDAEIDKLKIKKIEKDFLQCSSIRVPLKDRKFLRTQDQMLLNVVNTNNWKRPIYFAVTVCRNNLMFPEEYFQFEGLVSRLHPEKVGHISNSSIINENFYNKYTFEGPFDSQGNLETELEAFVADVANNYSSILLKLAYDEINNQNIDKARDHFSFARRFKSEKNESLLDRIEKLIISKQDKK